jgi:hypothetical protein
MKKCFLVLAVLVLFVQLASAYYLPSARTITESTVQAFVDVFEPILDAVFGGTSYSSYLLFEKLLLFLILLGIVYVAVGFVPMLEEQPFVRWIVAIIVPLLGVRFLEEGWLVTIILQYQVLAIALTSVLPFIIYFFFLQNVGTNYSSIRKIGWVLFIVVYLGLWSTVENAAYSSIYFWTMIVSLLFLLFDGTIHQYFLNQEMKAIGANSKWENIAKLRRDIQELNHDSGIPERIAKRLVKQKERKIAGLMKH